MPRNKGLAVRLSTEWINMIQDDDKMPKETDKTNVTDTKLFNKWGHYLSY